MKNDGPHQQPDMCEVLRSVKPLVGGRLSKRKFPSLPDATASNGELGDGNKSTPPDPTSVSDISRANTFDGVKMPRIVLRSPESLTRLS